LFNAGLDPSSSGTGGRAKDVGSIGPAKPDCAGGLILSDDALGM